MDEHPPVPRPDLGSAPRRTPRPPLPDSPARTHSRIHGFGSYRPRRIVGNRELAARLGVTEDWIESRTGIRDRRFASPDETLAFMAAAAGAQALQDAAVPATDIDLVLLASTSNLLQTPPTAVSVAHDLGARAAACIDLSAACAGFCHALALASDAVRCGSARHVLIIGAERMTDIVDPRDPAMAFIFADGAGAAVVGPADHPGIGPVARGADGLQFDALRMSRGWDEYATADPQARPDPARRPWLTMDGGKVFRWAVEEVCAAMTKALAAAGLTAGDIDVFIPHQANLRMINLMARRIGLSEKTLIARDVEHSGNTSSASVPLALDALRGETAGPRISGATALLVGFGAGLNYAGQVVVLP